MPTVIRAHTSHGFTLIEILFTLVILAFGLLGLVNLQTKLHMSELEAYQRAQAVVMVQDYAARIQAGVDPTAFNNPYVTGASSPIGGGTALVACSGSGQTRDACEWGNTLRGATECTGTATECAVATRSQNAGAMLNARGCVEEMQDPDPTTCTPGVYRVTVAWQGLYPTVEPGLPCAANLNVSTFGGGAFRRAISTTVTIGLPGCLP